MRHWLCCALSAPSSHAAVSHALAHRSMPSLSVCLFFCLCVCRTLCFCLFLSMYLSVSPALCHSLSFSISLYLSRSLSLSLSLSLSPPSNVSLSLPVFCLFLSLSGFPLLHNDSQFTFFQSVFLCRPIHLSMSLSCLHFFLTFSVSLLCPCANPPVYCCLPVWQSSLN